MSSGPSWEHTQLHDPGRLGHYEVQGEEMCGYSEETLLRPTREDKRPTERDPQLHGEEITGRGNQRRAEFSLVKSAP